MENTNTTPAVELVDLILDGGENIAKLVGQLGTAYEETKKWPSQWASKVIRCGIVAGVEKELLRWLILRDFANRDVPHEVADVNRYIDGLYKEQKEIFDRRGYFVGWN